MRARNRFTRKGKSLDHIPTGEGGRPDRAEGELYWQLAGGLAGERREEAIDDPVLVFDINETLLDLRGLDPAFEEAFGERTVRSEWFAQLLRSALTATVTEAYRDFDLLADAALTMVAKRRGKPLGQAHRRRILDAFGRLPPHPEVPAALDRLAAAGFRLAALTNSAPATAERQLLKAGLVPRFEKVMSVDEVRRFKPHPQVYRHAARSLGIEIGHLLLVAAHDWDTSGALRAGARAAFVARPGMVLDPLAPVPEVVGSDLAEVAERLIERTRSG